MKINKKVFVVTGAASGIGKALVGALVDRGAQVAAVDKNVENLSGLLNQYNSKDIPVISVHQVDITHRQDVESLPKKIIDIHGQIDAVINNAGIIQPFVKLTDLDYEVIERVMNVNFYGTLYMIKSFIPHLLRRPEGYVVNVSSMGGFLPVPGQSVYGASKAAVKLLTEGLFAELVDTHIHVSVVFPGATDTKITQNSGVKSPVSDVGKASAYQMLSANDVARIILKGIEHNNPQIFTGRDSTMMNMLYRMNPVFATKLITKQMKSLLK